MKRNLHGPSNNRQRVLVLACGALARELREIISTNGLNNIDLEYLPASYHNTPNLIPEAVAKRVREVVNRYDKIFVGYGDCGTGGRLDKVCQDLGAERLQGAHCYEIFAGEKTFAELQESEPGTFYLTDYLARNFERLVIRSLGLDRHPELRDVYFHNYSRLVYLAQQDDPNLRDRALAAANQLGLTLEIRHTGYGDLERTIVDFPRQPKSRNLTPPSSKHVLVS